MDVTRVNIPEDIVRSDPKTSGFMDEIGLWIGPSATLAAIPVRRGIKPYAMNDAITDFYTRRPMALGA